MSLVADVAHMKGTLRGLQHSQADEFRVEHFGGTYCTDRHSKEQFRTHSTCLSIQSEFLDTCNDIGHHIEQRDN